MARWYVFQRANGTGYISEQRKQLAKIIKESLSKLGYKVYGAINAPYIWLKTTDNLSSWEFFDKVLHTVQVVGTPGSGFGASGEGYFRLSAFGSKENVLEAMDRFKSL